MSGPGALADKVLEATVVGSFSRIGFDVRSRTERWQAPWSMQGRTAVVTGATSGLGYEIASQLVSLGATVWLLARDEARARKTRRALVERVPGAKVEFVLADLSDLAAVRRAAARLREELEVLDVLVHNAGTLSSEYRVAPDGTESTVAGQLLGPFVLTNLLLDKMGASGPGRVITVSSGGMYTQRFDIDALEMGPEDYDGVTAYARVKRAQVVINHEWARRADPAEVVFHAMHPGWTDTPGIHSSLPTFSRVMRPILRTPRQGADTVVWLSADPEGGRHSGSFWLDRRRRTEHRLPWTHSKDPGADQRALWEWCAART